MDWQELTKSLFETTISLNSPCFWAVVYGIGLFTWGSKESRAYVRDFNDPCDAIDRVLHVVGAFFCWITSPTWFAARFSFRLFMIGFAASERALGLGKRGGWTSSADPS